MVQPSHFTEGAMLLILLVTILQLGPGVQATGKLLNVHFSCNIHKHLSKPYNETL